MSDTEIPDDVRQQALDAAAPVREAMSEPATAEPVQQVEPDVPQDMSAVPDAYDVQGQEDYRADQRQEAVAANAAAPDQTPEDTAVASVNDLSPEDQDAALQQGLRVQRAIDEQEFSPASSVPDAATSALETEVSPSDLDAELQNSQSTARANDEQQLGPGNTDATPDEDAPSQEDALDLTPEPETPEPSGPEPE